MSEISASQMMPRSVAHQAAPLPAALSQAAPAPAALPQAAASDAGARMKEASLSGDGLSFGQASEEAARDALTFAEDHQTSVLEMETPHAREDGESRGGDGQGGGGSGGQQGNSQGGGSGGSSYYFDKKDDKSYVDKSEKSASSSSTNEVDSQDLHPDDDKKFSDLLETPAMVEVAAAMIGGAWITSSPNQPNTTTVPQTPDRGSARVDRQYDQATKDVSAHDLRAPRRATASAQAWMQSDNQSKPRRKLVLMILVPMLVCAVVYYRSPTLLRSPETQGVLNSLALKRDAAEFQMNRRFDELKQKIRASTASEAREQDSKTPTAQPAVDQNDNASTAPPKR